MTCNISAIPDATVEWYKDGNLVPSGTSISTTPDVSTQLTISSATPTDSGMYQCVVSNAHGDDVGTISLQVRNHGKGPMNTLYMCVSHMYVHMYINVTEYFSQSMDAVKLIISHSEWVLCLH